MAKKKELAIKDWNELDNSLRRLCEIERDVTKQESRLNQAVEKLKDKHKQEAAPLIAERKQIERDIERFCEERKAEIGPAKSRKLTFGTVAFRQVTKLLIHAADATIAAIKQILPEREDELISVTEAPNKPALADLDDGTLLALGCRRKTEDAFRIELDQERIDA